MSKRILLLTAACGLCAALGLSASPVIQFTISPAGMSGGQSLFQYNYTLSGFSFSANQELDIAFDPAVFSQLSNGIAGAGFSLLLFQPNAVPPIPGDYSALATVNNPSLAGPFSVDFTLIGSAMAGAQAFSINQFDSTGNFQGVVASGVTTAAASGVPEPASLWLSGLGFVFTGVFFVLRRSRKRQAGI